MEYIKCSICRRKLTVDLFNGKKTCTKCLEYIRSTKYKEYRKELRDNNVHCEIFRSSRNRAKLKGLNFDLTKEYIRSIFPKDNICPIRNVIMHANKSIKCDDSFSIDKIDPQKGYVKDNIQIISFKANIIKSNCTLTELELFYNLKKPEQHETYMIYINSCFFKDLKYRAKKYNIPFDIDLEYIKSIFPIDNCCPVFGVNFLDPSNRLNVASIDKIDPKLGYVKDNVQIISARANLIKNNCSMEELLSIIKGFRNYYDRTGSGIVLS